jgi:hypothetical protein
MNELNGIKVLVVSKDVYEKIIKPTNTIYFSNINPLDYNDIPEAVTKEDLVRKNHSFKDVKKRNEFFNKRK